MKFLLLMLGLFCSNLAQAALIQLQAEQGYEQNIRSYQLGESIRLELKITDVTEPLAAFWTQIMYQPAGLRLQHWAFGNGLNAGSGSLQFAEHNAAAGFIMLDEYAFAATDKTLLAAAQQPGFVLATLTFQALQPGDFQLMFNQNWLGAESVAGQLINTQSADFTLKVTATEVPAPATALLLLAGITLLSSRRSRLWRNNKAGK